MSGLFGRRKTRKAGQNPTTNNENEITATAATTALAFDEQGFLCPICHQKFDDHTDLAQHYTQTHAEDPTSEKENTSNVKNGNKQEDTFQEDPAKELPVCKQQLTASEESRKLLNHECMQQKQRADDLEEELELLKKHLKTTQARVAEQSQEIANFKASKDVYDPQIGSLTGGFLNNQGESQEKRKQVAIRYRMTRFQTLEKSKISSSFLSFDSRSTDDDTDVLKRELDSTQTRLNTLSVEREQEAEKLRLTLQENQQSKQRFKQLENRFYQNESEIEQLKQTNASLSNDLEQQKKLSAQLSNDFENEHTQNHSSRAHIESLTNEMQQLEQSLRDLKEEKNQLIQAKMADDQDDERQTIVRQINQEKDQYEQQTKELRGQLKQIHQQRQQIQDDLEKSSKQLSQMTLEKNQLQNERTQSVKEIEMFRKQLNDKERRISELENELSVARDQYVNTENSLRKTSDNQKEEIKRLRADLREKNNRIEHEKNQLQERIAQKEQLENNVKLQLSTIQKEKEHLDQQFQFKQQTIDKLQSSISQLHQKLDQKDNRIQRLSTDLSRAVNIAQRVQQNIQAGQMNILAMMNKTEEQARLTRTENLEQIREEYIHYLSTVQRLIKDNQTKLEKQADEHQQSNKQMIKIKSDHEKLISEHRQQNQKLGELNSSLLKVSESLSDATQTVDRQREKYEKQISSLDRELESCTKKHEMQLSALKENLATVRTELRNTHGKLATVDQLRADKTELEARLVVGQDERRALLERSLAGESKNEKLVLENGQLTKKTIEMDAALQEIAREYQVLQMQVNKLNQRRWVNDDDIRACMKCSQTFSVTQRKHHCRNCGKVFCDTCSSKTAIVAASSKKPQRVCDQCYQDISS